MWLTSIYHRSTVCNDAEMEHTPYSYWSTCTVFDTPEPKLMHLTKKKLTMLAIIGVKSGHVGSYTALIDWVSTTILYLAGRPGGSVGNLEIF